MDSLLQLISSPYVWLIVKLLLGYWLFSALVDTIPAPNGSSIYKYIFSFLHAFAGNLKRASVALKVPGAN